MIFLNTKRTKDMKVRTKFSLRGLRVFGLSSSLSKLEERDGGIFNQ